MLLKKTMHLCMFQRSHVQYNAHKTMSAEWDTTISGNRLRRTFLHIAGLLGPIRSLFGHINSSFFYLGVLSVLQPFSCLLIKAPKTQRSFRIQMSTSVQRTFARPELINKKRDLYMAAHDITFVLTHTSSRLGMLLVS
jgi:hypothetical protein